MFIFYSKRKLNNSKSLCVGSHSECIGRILFHLDNKLQKKNFVFVD